MTERTLPQSRLIIPYSLVVTFPLGAPMSNASHHTGNQFAWREQQRLFDACFFCSLRRHIQLSAAAQVFVITYVEGLGCLFGEQVEDLLGVRTSVGGPEILVSAAQLGTDIIQSDALVSITLENRDRVWV